MANKADMVCEQCMGKKVGHKSNRLKTTDLIDSIRLLIVVCDCYNETFCIF